MVSMSAGAHAPRAAGRARLVWMVLLMALVAMMPATASALDARAAVAGANKAWLEGEISSQVGLNCSILGAPYSEIILQGAGAYGGRDGIPAVGEQYWVSYLVAVPGNACATGNVIVETDLALPAGTAFDAGRSVRCFLTSRDGATTAEASGYPWNYLGSSGEYCPAVPSPSPVVSGGLYLGYRPLTQGQMFEIFVPVTSSQPLDGLAGGHAFRWYSTSTGVYENGLSSDGTYVESNNPGLSRTWATVLASASGGGPMFITSGPVAQPFWKADAPSSPVDLRSRLEMWLNLYTAGQPGQVCFEVRRQSDNSPLIDCASNPAVGFNGSVAPGLSIVQVIPGGPEVTGPNGGYAPFAFNQGDWGTPATLNWTFTPAGGTPITQAAPFTVLSGPDSDGDGVADSIDACPARKGTLPNGCLPGAISDPDGDGVYGTRDLCPMADGKGSLDGCPPGAGASTAASTSLGRRIISAPRRASLAAGIRLRVRYSATGRITAVGTIPRAAARARGLPQVVARGRTRVRKAGPAALVLRPTAQARARLAQLAGLVMTVRVRVPGWPGTARVRIRLR